MEFDGVEAVTFQQLIDAGLLQIGDGYRAKNEELGGDGPIFLRAGHVSDVAIDFHGVERFHSHLAIRVAGKMSQPGDAVITTKGNSTGRVIYIHGQYPQFVYSPHLSYWRSCKPEYLVPRFLYYWSRTTEFKTQLEAMSTSTDMAPYLSLSDQRRLKICVPPPESQRAIADLLGSFDDKIECNRRMNRTLEGIARAVFQSWFVDFDPVRAKADGCIPAGVDAVTAALFPDRFVDSEVGKIPAGWKVGSIGGEFGLTMGQSPPGTSYNELGDGVAFYQGKTDFGFRYPSPRVYCTAPTRFANKGDTLVSVRAPVGAINMAGERSCVGRGIAAIRHKSGSRSYTYYTMQLLETDFARFEAEGTVFGSINKADFSRLMVLVPGLSLMVLLGFLWVLFTT
jgi:type I restriction enzyme, S subunit